MSDKISWNKLGMVFEPGTRHNWMKEFAQVPVPIVLEERVRVFFTCRPGPDADGMYVSYIGYVDLDRNDLTREINYSKHPVIELGGPGDFDEHGTHPAGIVRKSGSEIWLYYQGWERSVGVPYKTSLGLAISKDGGRTFEKYSKGPIMSRTPKEPYLENGFFIFPRGDNDFLMIYATCTKWLKGANGRMEPYYYLTSAESEDGVVWNRTAEPLIEGLTEMEVQGRPSLWHDGQTYHLWFCYRNVINFRAGDGGYHIGYATSTDGKDWKRNDEQGAIMPSNEGWDSEMVAYPYVIEIDGKTWMFYNGNEFGKHGFGIAELIK